MFAAFTGTADKENGDEGWLSRAVSKVSRGVDNITHAASSVTHVASSIPARTANLLDFRSGATDVICLRSEVRTNTSQKCAVVPRRARV